MIIHVTKAVLLDDAQWALVKRTYVSTRTPSRASCKCKRCDKTLPVGTLGRGAFCIRDNSGMPIVKGLVCHECLHGGNQ
jgi:hypothetical protein